MSAQTVEDVQIVDIERGAVRGVELGDLGARRVGESRMGPGATAGMIAFTDSVELPYVYGVISGMPVSLY